MIKCIWCGDELKFIVGKSWIHKSTNTLYIQRKRTTEEIIRLRKYGYNPNPDELIDDHCALPDRTEGGK
jgi:hypothetical protein